MSFDESRTFSGQLTVQGGGGGEANGDFYLTMLEKQRQEEQRV